MKKHGFNFKIIALWVKDSNSYPVTSYEKINLLLIYFHHINTQNNTHTDIPFHCLHQNMETSEKNRSESTLYNWSLGK